MKRKMINDVASLTLATVVSRGIDFVKGILIASLLGPSLFGLWRLIQIALGYALNIDLGLFSAMGKEVPIAVGKREYKKSIYIEDTVFFGSIVLSLCAVSFFIIIYFAGGKKFQFIDITFLILICIFLPIKQVYTFYITLLRARHNFRTLSIVMIVFAVVSLLFSVVLTYFMHINGLLLSLILSHGLVILLILYRTYHVTELRFNIEKIKNLIKIGMQIRIATIVYIFFITIDSLMIGYFLGKTQLGYYGIAVMIFNMVQLIPSIFSQVLYPRIGEEYGRVGTLGVKKFVKIPVIYISILLIFIVSIIYFIFPLFIKIFLSAYTPGIPAMKILIFGVYFLGAFNILGNIIVVMGKTLFILKAQIIVLLINILLNYYLLISGFGIRGVALGTSISYCIYGILLAMYTMRLINNKISAGLLFCGKNLLYFTINCGILLIIDNYFKLSIICSNVFIESISKLILFLLINLILFFNFYKAIDLFNEIRGIEILKIFKDKLTIK
jgi:O-antigen/teichoic acid export membrane protein